MVYDIKNYRIVFDREYDKSGNGRRWAVLNRETKKEVFVAETREECKAYLERLAAIIGGKT
jgi:hypothetical protein